MSTKLPEPQAAACGVSLTPAPDPLEPRLDAWMQAISRQDEQALAAFYDATLGRVYGLALRIVRKAELAEEVVMDVYLQVWRKAITFDADRGSVLAWLLTICRSRALDALRRLDPAESHPEPDSLNPELALDESDPLDLLQSLEQQSAIHQALEKLKPIQRQMIALAFFNGLSHQEIASHVNLPLGTVKTHIRRALEQLQLSLPSLFKEA